MKEKHIKIIVACFIQALSLWFIYLEYHLFKNDNRYAHMLIFTFGSILTQLFLGGLIVMIFEEDIQNINK